MRRGGGFYYRTIQDFKWGLVTSGERSGRGEAPIGALLEAENIRTHTGTVVKRDGQEYLDEDIYVDENINGLYQYARQYNTVGGVIDVYRAYVFGAEDKLYLWDGVGDDTVWLINDSVNLPAGWALTSDDIYCATYLDWMYIMNGYECIKLDGTTAGVTNLPAMVGYNKPIYFKDRIYCIDESTDPSVIIFSDVGDPETFGADNWIDAKRDDGDYVTVMGVRHNTLYIFKGRSIWTMTGDPLSVPLIDPFTGSENTPSQNEFGIGCTSPRSLASVGHDLIFYSKQYGVYKISDSGIQNISAQVQKDITGLDDVAGGIYVDSNGDQHYVLSGATGDAWVCHLPTNTWTQDANVNATCWLIDADGYLLGGKGGYINRYYKPDTNDDNDDIIECKLKTHWLNLQDGHLGAELRWLNIQAQDMDGFFTISVYNETEQQPIEVITAPAQDSQVDFSRAIGRLFSFEIKWRDGNIESIVPEYLKRRLRY